MYTMNAFIYHNPNIELTTFFHKIPHNNNLSTQKYTVTFRLIIRFPSKNNLIPLKYKFQLVELLSIHYHVKLEKLSEELKP